MNTKSDTKLHLGIIETEQQGVSLGMEQPHFLHGLNTAIETVFCHLQ